MGACNDSNAMGMELDVESHGLRPTRDEGTSYVEAVIDR